MPRKKLPKQRCSRCKALVKRRGRIRSADEAVYCANCLSHYADRNGIVGEDSNAARRHCHKFV